MPTLRLEGTAQGAIKATTDLDKAMAALGDEIKETTRESNKLNRQAERIKESIEPQRRYNRQVEQTARLVKSGRLSFDEAQSAVQRYGRSLQRAGNEQRRSFGSNAAQRISAFASSYLSLSNAVSLLVNNFRSVSQEAKQAADSSFEALSAMGELQQLAGGDPVAFRALTTESRALVSRGIFRPAQEALAFRTVFDLESAGFRAGERQTIANLAAQRIIAPENIPAFASQLRGFAGVGPAAQPIDESARQIFAASKEMRATATETATAAAPLTGAIAPLGFSRQNALALLAALNQRFGIQDAGVRAQRFLTAVEQRQLPGRNIEEVITGLAGRVQRGERLIDIIPEQRARQGAQAAIDFFDFFQQAQQNIATRPIPAGAMAQDPMAQALMMRALGAGRRFDATRERRQRQAELEAFIEDFRARQPGVMGAMTEQIMRLEEAISPGLARRVAGSARAVGQMDEEQREFLQRQTEAAERTADAVDRPNPQPSGRQE